MAGETVGNANRTATIASGGTTTGPIDIRGFRSVGVITPSALTGTALTFTVSATKNGTYVPLRTTGSTAVSLTVSTSGAYQVATSIEPFSWMKIVSGSTEAADRTLLVPLKA